MTTTEIKAAAKTQAQNALTAELSRRNDRRRRESERLFRHAGAYISRFAMSEVERWDFLLAAYDAALDNDGEVPHGFAAEWNNS